MPTPKCRFFCTSPATAKLERAPNRTPPAPREDAAVTISRMIEARQRPCALPRTVILILCLLVAACGSVKDDAGGSCAGGLSAGAPPPTLDMQDPGVSRHNLRAWIELLTSPRLRGRHAGEDGARHTAALVAAHMARIGLVPPAPSMRGDDHCRGFPFLGVEDYNVVGHLLHMPPSGTESRLPASDRAPAAADERPIILLSAHYDGQGVHPAGMVYPGADDNASGVAALLEVARLAVRRPASRIDWIFVAFGAEEGGQQGSRAYLSTSSAALSRIELAVNLDMVGRPLPGERGDAIGYLVSGRSTPETLARLRAAANDSGLEVRSLETVGELMPAISDAQVLATRLPTLLLSTALHEDHHQLTDTPERIDYGQIERTVRLVLELGAILSAPR